MKEEDISIYPNPASGSYVNVALSKPEMVERIDVMNVSGQVITSEYTVNQTTGINISDLSDGLYVIKIVLVNGENRIKKMLVR